MSDLGEFSSAIRSVGDLVQGILSRADRDGPDKEKEENIITLQNAYAKNEIDTDEFRLFIDRLCNKAGTPLVATRDVDFARRELIHALLINTINLIHERELSSRAFNKLVKP